MKKSIFLICVILVLSNISVYAFDENERISSLMNYVQLSTCKILESENKGFIEDEFSAVLNNIEPSSLKNKEIIEGYEYLLSTLTELKITNNERKHLEIVAEQKRKNAIFNSLNSFGSVLFVSSKDPILIGISLAYTTVNAGFNYARTVNEINIEKEEKTFQLDQTDLRTIDQQRTSLFTTVAKVYADKPFTSEKIINEKEMRYLARVMAEIDSAISDEELKNIAKKNIQSIKKMEKNFSTFSPYWLVLGILNFNMEKYEDANIAFKKVYEVDIACNIFKNKKSPYIKDAAKQCVLLCMKTGNSDIHKYLRLVQENSNLDQTTQDDNSYFFCTTYLYLKEFKAAKQEIQYLYDRGIEPEYGDLTCQYNLLSLPESDKNYKISETMLKAHIILNAGLKVQSELFTEKFKSEFQYDEKNGIGCFIVFSPKEEIRFVDVTNTELNSYSYAITKDFYYTEKKGIFSRKTKIQKNTLKIHSISIKEDGIMKTYIPDEKSGLWK